MGQHNFDQIAAPRRYTREASANAAEHVGAYRSWGDGASGGASAGTADQPPSARCVLSRKSTTRSTAAACVALRAPPSRLRLRLRLRLAAAAELERARRGGGEADVAVVERRRHRRVERPQLELERRRLLLHVRRRRAAAASAPPPPPARAAAVAAAAAVVGERVRERGEGVRLVVEADVAAAVGGGAVRAERRQPAQRVGDADAARQRELLERVRRRERRAPRGVRVVRDARERAAAGNASAGGSSTPGRTRGAASPPTAAPRARRAAASSAWRLEAEAARGEERVHAWRSDGGAAAASCASIRCASARARRARARRSLGTAAAAPPRRRSRARSRSRSCRRRSRGGAPCPRGSRARGRRSALRAAAFARRAFARASSVQQAWSCHIGDEHCDGRKSPGIPPVQHRARQTTTSKLRVRVPPPACPEPPRAHPARPRALHPQARRPRATRRRLAIVAQVDSSGDAAVHRAPPPHRRRAGRRHRLRPKRNLRESPRVPRGEGRPDAPRLLLVVVAPAPEEGELRVSTPLRLADALLLLGGVRGDADGRAADGAHPLAPRLPAGVHVVVVVESRHLAERLPPVDAAGKLSNFGAPATHRSSDASESAGLESSRDKRSVDGSRST